MLTKKPIEALRRQMRGVSYVTESGVQVPFEELCDLALQSAPEEPRPEPTEQELFDLFIYDLRRGIAHLYAVDAPERESCNDKITRLVESRRALEELVRVRALATFLNKNHVPDQPSKEYGEWAAKDADYQRNKDVAWTNAEAAVARKI